MKGVLKPEGYCNSHNSGNYSFETSCCYEHLGQKLLPNFEWIPSLKIVSLNIWNHFIIQFSTKQYFV
jgi:hypothetical protein